MFKALAVYDDGTTSHSCCTYPTEELAQECINNWKRITFVPPTGKRLIGFLVKPYESDVHFHSPYNPEAIKANKLRIVQKYMRVGKLPPFHWAEADVDIDSTNDTDSGTNSDVPKGYLF